MDEIMWDIQQVKRLKKKSLLEFNGVMLLVFLFCALYIYMEWPASVFFGITCIIIWFFVAHSLYILITGKTTGSKINKLVQAFDRDRSGDKRWKRSKIGEVLLFVVLGIVCTVLVFPIEIDSEPLRYINISAFFGAWFGANVGSIIRISSLE